MAEKQLLDRDDILVGAPDQQTTGAIFSAPIGTPLPEYPGDELDKAFVGSGYVNEDGVTITPEKSKEGIKDWSLEVVRELLTEFKNSIAWAHLSTSKESLKNYFGDENVTTEVATDEHGNIIRAKLNAKDYPRKSWVFRIKDGDNRVLIVVPDGQIGEVGEVPFQTGAAITWPVTMSTFPDKNGDHVHFIFDDGKKLTAGEHGVGG